MKPRTECRVEKRCGRREWFRTTKLVRSIHLALQASGDPGGGTAESYDMWQAADLAEAVLFGVQRLRRAAGIADQPLPTSLLADAVQRVLLANGQRTAAEAYLRTAVERVQRQKVLAHEEWSDTPGRGNLPARPVPEPGR